jgi:hypothetical protein
MITDKLHLAKIIIQQRDALQGIYISRYPGMDAERTNLLKPFKPLSI